MEQCMIKKNSSEFLCIHGCVVTVALCMHYITSNKFLSLSLSLSLYWAPKLDLIVFEKILGRVYQFYIFYSVAPLTMLGHLFGHFPTLPRLKGPFWTFMDPQMDPKMDPARLISGHLW